MFRRSGRFNLKQLFRALTVTSLWPGNNQFHIYIKEIQKNVEKENDLAVDIHHDGCWYDNNKHGLFDYAKQKR